MTFTASHTSARLAHGWRLAPGSDLEPDLIREFVRAPVRAVPRTVVARLKPCAISLPGLLDDGNTASCWTDTGDSLEIHVAVRGVEPHDVAMEILICLGQALWAAAGSATRTAWMELLRDEIDHSVLGEIDEDALREKRKLFAGLASARSPRRMADYARISFAGTLAEYIHCLWHDVTVRTGPEHLPSEWLGHRLEMLHRWFPPDRRYRLFPRR